jgi:hypothetical protein
MKAQWKYIPVPICGTENWSLTSKLDIKQNLKHHFHVRGVLLFSRFCVFVRRHHYPIEKSQKESSAWIQPGHTISIVPAILLVNLLPCYLRYKLKDSDATPENIEPGKESCLAVS